MSRRTSATQRIVVMRNKARKTATSSQDSVMLTIAPARAAEFSSGRMLGGRHVDLFPHGRSRAVEIFGVVAHYWM